MVGVGINENVVLSKAEVITEADKVSLSIVFREVAEAKSELSAFDQLAGAGTVETGSGNVGTTIRVWPPLAPLPTTKEGAAKTLGTLAKESADNLGEIKNILFSILSCYMTSDKIVFSMFSGMESVITPETYEAKIADPLIIKAAFTNLANQFTAMVTPFLDKNDCGVRLLLVRQSKEKHYATFRNRFVLQNPFIESAAIPKDASKIKFNAYELKNGLDKGDPIAQSTADAPGSTAPSSVTNMFDEPALGVEPKGDAGAILNS